MHQFRLERRKQKSKRFQRPKNNLLQVVCGSASGILFVVIFLKTCAEVLYDSFFSVQVVPG